MKNDVRQECLHIIKIYNILSSHGNPLTYPVVYISGEWEVKFTTEASNAPEQIDFKRYCPHCTDTNILIANIWLICGIF